MHFILDLLTDMQINLQFPPTLVGFMYSSNQIYIKTEEWNKICKKKLVLLFAYSGLGFMYWIGTITFLLNIKSRVWALYIKLLYLNLNMDFLRSIPGLGHSFIYRK